MSEVIELLSEDEKDVKSIVVQKKKKVKVWRKDEK